MSRKRSESDENGHRPALKKPKNTNNNNSSRDNTATSSLKRYRFKNFNERIEEVEIGSIQKIGGYRGSGPTGTDTTWFELSLNEWKELNCSAAFAKFCYAVTPMTGTLAKLLFNRDRIVAEIFEVLRRANEEGPESPTRLALVPILSLTAMLAKDLGSEFLVHFPQFYQLLLPILPSAADPEIIEAAFASLLYVFKCLLEDLLNDLAGTFEMVAKPLLGISESKSHLKKFGAQCFGYLLRKSVNISSSGLFQRIQNDNEDENKENERHVTEFMADAFVAAILDDSTGRLRNCLKPLYLEIAQNNRGLWNDVLRLLTVKLLDETDLNTNTPIWKILVQLAEDPEMVPVLIDALAYRRGTRVQFHSDLVDKLAKNPAKSVELAAHFLRSMNLEATLQNRQATLKFVRQVLDLDGKKNLVLLCKWLVELNYAHYDLVLNDFVRAFVASDDSEDAVLVSLLEIVLDKYPSASTSIATIPRVFQVLSSCITIDTNDRSLSMRAQKILVDHFPAKFPESLKKHFIDSFKGYFKESAALPPRDELILCTQVISQLDSQEFSIESPCFSKFLAIEHLRYPEQLKAVRLALRHVKGEDVNLMFPSAILRSCSSEWRQEALDLIGHLHKDQLVVSLLQGIEGVPSDLQNYREKLLQLKKLDHIKPEELTRESVQMILNYLIGFLQIKLSLLWPEGCKMLAKYAAKYSEEYDRILKEIFAATTIDATRDNTEYVENTKDENVDGSYYGIDDAGLNNLERIRSEVDKLLLTDDASITESVGHVIIFDNATLIPAVLKSFAANPESCIPDGFKETLFLPLIINTFKGSATAASNTVMSSMIQSNLSAVLQALAGTRLECKTVRSEDLESLLLRFLAHGDLQLQAKALEAVLNTKKYGGALSNQWKTRLRSLLNDNLFREELTSLTAEADSLPRVVHWHTLLAPLIVRILFGRFIARRGAAAGRHSLPLRRKMIMSCFGTWDQGSLALIVDFLLEGIEHTENESTSVTVRQRLGFLNVLGDVFGSLGRKLDEESMNRLVRSLLDIYAVSIDDDTVDNEDTEDKEDTEDNSENNAVDNSTDRRVRQLVMKRFLQLFKIYESNVLNRLAPFLPDLFTKILNPRINQLATHFTQSNTSSALLEILVCFTQNLSEEDLIKVLTEWAPELWKKSVEAFAVESTKPLIVSQLLTVFEGVILPKKRGAAASELLLSSVVVPEMELMLDAFDGKLKNTSQSNTQNILRIVAMVQILAPYVKSSAQAARLCKTFEALLKIKTIFEGIRTHLIGAMVDLLKKSEDASVSRSLFEITSAQWNVLKSRPGRESLCKLFDCYAEIVNTSEFEFLAGCLRELNAWMPGKLGEPDFDLRLSAFAKLRKSIDSGDLRNSENSTLDVMVPVAWAMIYFLQDLEELSIRNQSFGVLKALINRLESESEAESETGTESVSMDIDTEGVDVDSETIDETMETEEITPKSVRNAPFLIQRIVLPSIKVGLKSRQEVIRIEFVALLDLLIETFPDCQPFSTLYALIRPIDNTQDSDVDLDEENIFRNIYHIQEPRRNRAIRQIGELAAGGRLQGLTRGIIEDLLLPLVLSTTLPDATGEIEFTVSEAMQKDSIATCGALLAQLPWNAFIKKLVQFVKEITENKKCEAWNRAVLRLLPAMISQFKLSENCDEVACGEFERKVNETVLPAMFRLLHKSESAGDNAEMSKKVAKTASGAPLGVDKISVKHSLRVPIAISIGQLIKIVSRGSLDSPVITSHLPKLLIDLLNVLKQKDADTRDVARGALVKIMGTFGTPFLPFLLREGRTLLNRGYQRHVLTYTAHAILVEFLRLHKQQENVKDGSSISLDASADLLIDMALASTFGFQASERATIEWSGKQPEVRAAKGPEIIALTAQFTSQSVLRSALLDKIIKMAGLELSEPGLNTRGTGALDEKSEALSKIEGEAFDLMLRSLFLNGLNPLLAREPERLHDLLACMHEILLLPCDSGTKSHMHRLHMRAFEFVSHVLNNTNDEGIIPRIVPFVCLTREYILEKGKHVGALTSAMTLFNQFISFKALHSSMGDLQPLLQKLFTIILKGSGSGDQEASGQLAAAYKLTATLIRDWPDLQVTDTQIKALIEYTRLQLENTHQQSLTFSLIRSLISRQIVLLQLFELMETVRSVMLTSHQPATRQQCRAAYIHFLTNYPMATKKLEEQLDFLLANVRYEFALGRESCIEVMAGLISKLPIEVIEGIAEAWFMGLAVQLAKEMSDGSLDVIACILHTITLLFSRLPQGKRRDNLELLLCRWITQSPKLSVQGAAWKLFLPLLNEISAESRDLILEKAVQLISTDSTPEDLLIITLESCKESVHLQVCPEEIVEGLVKEASEPRFFKEDCEFKVRHSIALLWNSLLSE